MKKVLAHLKDNWYQYALETLVVIIGILIAFSLSNWKESIKDRKKERESLESLKTDLAENLMEIKEIREREIEKRDASDSLLLFLFKNEDYNRRFIRNARLIKSHNIFNSPKAAYSYLESEGIDFTKNDTLRKSIIEIYEQDFKNIHYRQEILLKAIQENYLPYLFKNFKPGIDTTGGVVKFYEFSRPIDYPTLRQDPQFQNLILLLKKNRAIRVLRLDPTIQKLEKIIEAIGKEIEKLS